MKKHINYRDPGVPAEATEETPVDNPAENGTAAESAESGEGVE